MSDQSVIQASGRYVPLTCNLLFAGLSCLGDKGVEIADRRGVTSGRDRRLSIRAAENLLADIQRAFL
jgi:hypothetical protein